MTFSHARITLISKDSLMSVRSLDCLIKPNSLALIGASARAGSLGHAVLTNLRKGGFAGSIQLVNPRFVGQDRRGRAFTLTARTATRDPKDYDRVLLDQPVLVLRRDPAEPIRVSSKTGDYNESRHLLKLNGDVRLNGGDVSFLTGASTFDTALGELVGDGAIQGVGSLGEINAKSYGVYDKGDRLVFGGGVSTRLEPKSGP
jgi:lipopolysaccharide export system protein LptC